MKEGYKRMKDENLNALWCPICKKKIQKKTKAYVCIQNHGFDIAKEGHANMLLPSQKHSKVPGDSKEMLESRRDFLNKGYYKGISDKINKVIINHFSNNNSMLNIADIGCGEGYYLSNFVDEFSSKKKVQIEAYGMDIAKDAVRFATKRSKDINWIVGNVIGLPFKDNSLDFILCMFSMIDFAECRRTLKPNGKLLFVVAGTDHLKQLREIVYPEIKEAKESELDKVKLKYLKDAGCVKVNYDAVINEAEDIANLFKMTPHYWKVKEEKKKELYAYSKLELTIDVDIEIFSK